MRPERTRPQTNQKPCNVRGQAAELQIRSVSGHVPACLHQRGPDPAFAQAVIASLAAELSPLSVRRYVATLRQVLDFAEIDPNPARDKRVAGVAHYSPHDLRHRYASVKIAEGVPVTELAAHLGHAKKSLTLDTYSHVLLAE